MNHLNRRVPRIAALTVALVLIAGCQGAGAASSTVAPSDPAATPTTEPTASASAPAQTARPTVSPSESPTAAAAIDPRTDGLDVGFGEFAITLEAAVIRPGPVTLIVHNAGTMTHGLELKLERSSSISGSDDSGSTSGRGSGSGRDREKIETRTFHSGETLRVEADLEPGIYEVECYVSGHASMGMRTTLTVRADAPLVTPDPGASRPDSVRIVQFAFITPELDVPVGTTVTWTNDDPAPHTVTADGTAFDSKQLDPGASFSTVFDTPGSYAYHCEIHPTMVATVLVQ